MRQRSRARLRQRSHRPHTTTQPLLASVAAGLADRFAGHRSATARLAVGARRRGGPPRRLTNTAAAAAAAAAAATAAGVGPSHGAATPPAHLEHAVAAAMLRGPHRNRMQRRGLVGCDPVAMPPRTATTTVIVVATRAEAAAEAAAEAEVAAEAVAWAGAPTERTVVVRARSAWGVMLDVLANAIVYAKPKR